MNSPNQQNNHFRKAKSWVVGMTGVLLVIPALIYSGIDIYNAFQHIPRTDAEKSNVELLQKYFGKNPVTMVPVPIKQGGATYEVKFSIYDEGDVFVEYGDMTQWFPFPKERIASNGFNIIASAYAGDMVQQYGSYKQKDKIQGDVLIRNKSYSSGIVEQQTIDIRSGKIMEVSQSQNQESQDEDILQQPIPEIGPFATIDLNAPSPDDAEDRAILCRTEIGKCTILKAVAKGSACSCPTSAGLSEGVAE